MIETKSFVAILTIHLHMPHSGSLKTKRRVLMSLKTKIRNQFNVSVSEIGAQDKWQRAVLGVSAIGGDQSYLKKEIQKIESILEACHEIEVLNLDLEIIT